MKISLNWLRNYVHIPEDTNYKALGELFTTRTAEVDGVINLAETFDKIVVGKIEEILPHPNADRLQITKTNIGNKTLQIVCGAKNIFVGQTVAVALIGAKVHWHGASDLITLTPTKIRGVESEGMICAASEIGLKDEVDGIMDLSHFNFKAGTPLAEALNKNDIIIEIDNKALTNRPDLWGHYGIAREIAAITDEKLRPIAVFENYPQISSKENPLSVEVKNPELCPRYLALMIDKIKVEPSPEWLKNALENIGQRSINNIVDATNFVMNELGQPMHAFDSNKIEKGIIVRTAQKDEKITTLDGEERKLHEKMLVIGDHKKPIALAGIMGGLHSGISNETTCITLEAANFDPTNVRKISVELGIRTESVQRFEKSLDPLLAEKALDRIVKIILDLCPGAKIISPKIDINHYHYKEKVIDLNIVKAHSKIGVEISEKEIKENLEKLEFKVKPSTHKNHFKVEVPSFRATKDINHEDDLIEEIARMYGYEKLPRKLPELSLKLPLPNLERKKKYLARKVLSDQLGFHEVYNYSFYSAKDLEKTGLKEEFHIKVKNYLSEEQTHLRISLIPNLLKNIVHNLKFKESFKIYEIGRTYLFQNQFFPLEEKKIAGCIVIPSKNIKKNISSPATGELETFLEVKGAIEHLLENFKIHSLGYRRAKESLSYAHPNKHAAYFDYQTEQELIHIFELHPLISKNFELNEYQIACFEINYTLLNKAKFTETLYKPIPKFPGIEIDISTVIDETIEIGQIAKIIKKADSELIEDVTLFDIYQGPNIPEKKKALAFKIKLQAPDRTLTDEDMKKVQHKIFADLQKIGGEIRGL